MTTLGQAYVQIMPSAKGISGSIQKTINPEATRAGRSAGRRIASTISQELGKAGKTLTKAITLPVLGATTAVTGIVAALGWGRLTGLDAARAQLQGLGYDAEAVERISGQVRDTIQGTVTTMAEGVSVAAGALAAGVKEGAELERYIKLVGDAAVGANRSTDEMAQIFNRVQGSGKLMTMELNMIEQGMPGFAMAMSKNLGVSQEAFRKMVTDGKVSSDQFLDVMEDFAGEMSDAYANSWAGMVANTKSNIGIIGENLLGGVFEQSKESIAEFLEFLRSDDLRAWAASAGEAIGDAFGKMIETIKGVIGWWTSLDGETQKFIGKMIGLAVAIGPILVIVSKIIGFISPIKLVIMAIVGLISIVANLYQTNEEFSAKVDMIWSAISGFITGAIDFISSFVQEVFGFLLNWWNDSQDSILAKVSEVWNFIQETIGVVIGAIVEFVMETFGTLVAWWQENNEAILLAVENVWNIITEIIAIAMDFIWATMEFLWPMIQEMVETTWESIKNAIQIAIDLITGIIDFWVALFTGDWEALWESVKNLLNVAWEAISSTIGLAIDAITTIISNAWEIIKKVTSVIWNAISGVISLVFGGISSTVSRVIGSIRDTISRIWNSIKRTTETVFNGIKRFFDNTFDSMKRAGDKFADAFGKVWDAIKTGAKAIASPIAGVLNGVMSGIESVVNGIAKAINAMPSFDIPSWVPIVGGKSFGLPNISTVSLPRVPSFDVGTDLVTSDGLAMLHAGEIVVPAKHVGPYTDSKGIDGKEVTQLLLELIGAVREGQNIIVDGDVLGSTVDKRFVNQSNTESFFRGERK